MYLIHTPKIIQNLFPGFVWRIPVAEPTVFLTFDDGPIPDVTPMVLEQLEQYNAKATFFCVGENVAKHPEIYRSILDAGHHVGNHTYNHLSGWTNDDVPYLHNVRKAGKLIKSNLFRPPYGKLKPGQVQFLLRHYNIIMWDILSGDFDPTNTPEKCISNVCNNVTPGSIVVFHDSLKARKNIEKALPEVLARLTEAGYTFRSIPLKGKLQARKGEVTNGTTVQPRFIPS